MHEYIVLLLCVLDTYYAFKHCHKTHQIRQPYQREGKKRIPFETAAHTHTQKRQNNRITIFIHQNVHCNVQRLDQNSFVYFIHNKCYTISPFTIHISSACVCVCSILDLLLTPNMRPHKSDQQTLFLDTIDTYQQQECSMNGRHDSRLNRISYLARYLEL